MPLVMSNILSPMFLLIDLAFSFSDRPALQQATEESICYLEYSN